MAIQPAHSILSMYNVLEKLIASNKFSQIILFDQIGHGMSDKPSDANFHYSVHRQVDLLQSLIQHLSVKRFHIMAHDLGDTVIQEFMSRIIDQHEENHKSDFDVESICYLNGGLIPTVYRPLMVQRLCLSPLKPMVIQLMRRASFRRSIGKTWGKRIKLTDDVVDKMWLGITHKNGVAPIVNILRYMKERQQFCDRWVNALKKSNEKLQIPSILINGSLDPISGKHIAKKFEELVPNATVIHLSDVGHWPNIEAPDDVCNKYLAFLSEN